MPLGDIIGFTPTLSAQVQPIRAVHVSELRARINDLRAQYGLAEVDRTDPVLGPAVTMKATHVSELRAALAAVYGVVERSPAGYTDAALIPGSTLIKASHITELRAAVTVIEALQ
jgi:hypothetical protein